MRVVRRVVVAFLAGFCIGLACEKSPFEPRGNGERIPIGVAFDQRLTGDSLMYSFVPTARGLFAVFLESQHGHVVVDVRDSVSQQFVTSVNATPTSGTLLQNASPTFAVQGQHVYQLRVTAVPASGAADFRFMVFAVNPAPELQPAVFLLGDTVTGETIDPIVDLDEFFAPGTSGQELIGVVEAVETSVISEIFLAIEDPIADTVLTMVRNRTDFPAQFSTERIKLTGSHDYRFRIGSVPGFGFRYGGKYRFWTTVVQTAPELLSPIASFNTEITGEVIRPAGDVDEYAFTDTAGSEINAFLQSDRPISLRVTNAAGGSFATTVAVPGDTGLFHHGTGRARLPVTGTYTVRIGDDETNLADTGGYRFLVYPIDRRPEHIPAVVAYDDTLAGDSLDRPGDVDEYTVAGTAGDEVRMLLQGQGAPTAVVRLDALDDTGGTVATIFSSGSDTSLAQRVSPSFILPHDGPFRLSVQGALTFSDRDVGPYRFCVYRIDHAPESHPATLAFGDSLAGEAIDVPGDIDEFQVTVPDTSGANLVVQADTAVFHGGLFVDVFDSGGQPIGHFFAPTGGGYGMTGTMNLVPGTYTVRVQGQVVEARGFGYRLWFYAFGLGPETASDSFAIGDTVRGESIDPLGDVDVFRFFGTRWQHVDLAFQGVASAPTGYVVASLATDAATPSFLSVESSTQGDSLGASRSNRIDLPVTGWYRVGVGSAGSPPGLGDRGLYRFAVTRLSIAPEQVADTIAPEDSVTTEAIDYPGDWDEYVLTAPPGQLLGILARITSGVSNPLLAVFDSATGDTAADYRLEVGNKLSPRFVMPPSGQLRLAIFETRGGGYCYDPACTGAFVHTGGYRVTLFPINTAPESAPAAIVVGDTILGESLETPADVDDFMGTGVPGSVVAPGIRLLQDPTPSGALIALEVIDPATNAVLLGGFYVIAATATFLGPGFTVPASGAYIIRVHSGDSSGYSPGTVTYDLRLIP